MIHLEPGSTIYFIGIGGIAMSATAGIARQMEYEVSGSDSNAIYDPSKSVLDDQKISYHIGYDASHITEAKADLYVFSAGEDLNNPEVKAVLDAGLPHAGFAELLHFLFESKLRIVVAGTHGKSTTSALLGHMFRAIDDSSYMVGGVLQNTGQNFYLGDGHYVVFEGDEYKNEFDDPTPKFHYYKPDILVLTNLEFDHPDMFENFEALEEEFRLLIADMPEDGLIVYNADNETLVKLVHESNISSVSFAIENAADFRVEAIKFDPDYTTFEVKNKFSKSISAHMLDQAEQYKIQLPGKINIYNALAAVATLRTLGFGQEQILLELLEFKGVKRRFELVGKKRGITVIDDYAHHPTAVRETLDAARLRFPKAKIWALFEPHTFSRTKATLPQLVTAFRSADEVLISEIYPAREKKSDATITSEEVVNQLKASRQPAEAGKLISEGHADQSINHSTNKSTNQSVRHVHDKQEALDILKKEAGEGDVVVVMAVGSFNKLAYELQESL